MAKRSGVYVIGSEAVPDVYKIGVTADLDQRLKSLQAACPVSLRVARFFEGWTVDDERALHARFAGSRLHGEWFRLPRGVVADLGHVRPSRGLPQWKPTLGPSHRCPMCRDLIVGQQPYLEIPGSRGNNNNFRRVRFHAKCIDRPARLLIEGALERLGA